MQVHRRFASIFVLVLVVIGYFFSSSSSEAQRKSDSGKEFPFIAGVWYSYFGVMEIEQTGATFEGTYSCCEGRIEGQMIGKRIDYTWKDAVYGEGWGYFFLEGNGNKLNGTWGEKDDLGGAGEWGAVRMVEPDYTGDQSQWRVMNNHGRFGLLHEGQAQLGIDGDRVEGKLTGYYMTEAGEKPYRVDLFLYIDGKVEGDEYKLEWEDPRYGLFGKVTLKRDGESLRGEWEPHGDYGKVNPIAFEPVSAEVPAAESR